MVCGRSYLFLVTNQAPLRLWMWMPGVGDSSSVPCPVPLPQVSKGGVRPSLLETGICMLPFSRGVVAVVGSGCGTNGFLRRSASLRVVTPLDHIPQVGAVPAPHCLVHPRS